MTIKSITRLEKRKNLYVAALDDESELRLTAEQLVLFGIHAGQELSKNEFNRLRDEIELSTTKAQAIRTLGKGNLSSGEMKSRLRSKGASDEALQETVMWLEDMGLINDSEYAAMIVRHYFGKGYGVARIRDELFRRGIPRDLWDEAMQDNTIDSTEAALIYLRKKLRGSVDKDECNRANDALCRRGFSYEDARDALKTYIQQTENEY